MNPRLALLQPYPFERLAALLANCRPNPQRSPISLAIGEPRHPPAECAIQALQANLDGLGRYPATAGTPALRQTIADWLARRYGLGHGAIEPDTQVLPLAGTREGLFAFTQSVIDASRAAIVCLPNPGYQIYEGAALLAGATPRYLPATADMGFLPDLDALTHEDWQRCQLLFLCSPGNPTGAVAPADYLRRALALAEQHDFVIASDECYSEIYTHSPPPGLLEIARAAGNHDFERCVVFHSLSKRSNLPGLRSGFAAGDAALLREFLRYRTYHGASLGLQAQAASAAAWADETHVEQNRALYARKFEQVMPVLSQVLDVQAPAGSFYLWPQLPVDDERFTRELLARENVRVVPGRYLARDSGTGNPGVNRVRLSLVAELDDCVEAACRIARVCKALRG